MQIYVISLDRSKGRKGLMRDQLEALGLRYKFFRAIDGLAGEHSDFKNYRDEFCIEAWRRPLTSGEVGCFASHYQLWQLCVERNEPMIVMEDDVEVTPRFAEAVSIVSRMLERTGYVRLAGVSFPEHRPVSDGLSPGWQLVRFLKGPMGTQCYALFPNAAARLLRKSGKWTMPVDTYIDSFWLHGVAAVGLAPFPIVIPRNLRSEISLDGPSPSILMRDRVSPAKRFVTRKSTEFCRGLKNLEYALLERL